MLINWIAVEAVANTCLVITSVGAISYAGLQLRHEREYRSVANLEKQLSFFLSESFVLASATAGSGPAGYFRQGAGANACQLGSRLTAGECI